MTTERVLPPVRPAGGAQPASSDEVPPSAAARRGTARPRGIAPTARLARARGDVLHSTATRAGMLVGVSAAIYAVSLASVAGLESQTQARAAADAQPALNALANSTALNDEMEAAAKDASARLAQLTHDYGSTSADMAAYQAKFDQLSALVAKIQGSAAAMNANFKLPTVTMRGAISSGGGGSTVVTTTAASGKP